MKTCQLCGNEFSLKVVVDGKVKNMQNRKFCLKCSPFGAHNTRTLSHNDNGELATVEIARSEQGLLTCSRCSREYVYDRKKGHHLTLCNSCSANRQRTRVKQRCVDYKGGACLKCGYKKALRSLGFHHRDPNEKEFTFSGKMSWAWQRLVQELDKCDLLCSNCHGETHEEIDSYAPVV